MEKSLETLKLEAEEERRQRYLKKFGFLPDLDKAKSRKLSEFN